MRERMTTSGVASARKKLARAKVHLDALRAEVESFRASSPHDFTHELKSY
jgi:hypothetical protein